jgi:hypothetical protein
MLPACFRLANSLSDVRASSTTKTEKRKTIRKTYLSFSSPCADHCCDAVLLHCMTSCWHSQLIHSLILLSSNALRYILVQMTYQSWIATWNDYGRCMMREPLSADLQVNTINDLAKLDQVFGAHVRMTIPWRLSGSGFAERLFARKVYVVFEVIICKFSGGKHWKKEGSR